VHEKEMKITKIINRSGNLSSYKKISQVIKGFKYQPDPLILRSECNLLLKRDNSSKDKCEQELVARFTLSKECKKMHKIADY
jgi:hypothetical protein